MGVCRSGVFGGAAECERVPDGGRRGCGAGTGVCRSGAGGRRAQCEPVRDGARLGSRGLRGRRQRDRLSLHRLTAGDQLHRDQDDDPGAPERRGPQLDLEAQVGGEPGHDVQAETGVVGAGHHVHTGWRGHQFVGLGVLLGVHAHAAVLDLDRDPATHPGGGHLDRGRRPGEGHRVLHQLREEMHHRTDRTLRQPGLAVGVDPDAPVVLHLALGGAHDVQQEDGPAPAALRGSVPEDDQVLLVAAQPGRQMVEVEEAFQDLGVLVPPLHLAETFQLHADQQLGAPGDALQEPLEAAVQLDLPYGGIQGRAAGLVEGLAELAEFVVAVVDLGQFGVGVDLLALAQPLHEVGQPLLEFQGLGAQAGDPAAQCSGQAQ